MTNPRHDPLVKALVSVVNKDAKDALDAHRNTTNPLIKDAVAQALFAIEQLSLNLQNSQ